MNPDSNKLGLNQAPKHIIIQRRYEVSGAINDLLIAMWFLIGSLFFLTASLVESGTWLFVVGSAQLLIKPTLKLISLVHVSRFYESKNG
jgi:hypothetical protein